MILLLATSARLNLLSGTYRAYPQRRANANKRIASASEVQAVDTIDISHLLSTARYMLCCCFRRHFRQALYSLVRIKRALKIFPLVGKKTDIYNILVQTLRDASVHFYFD